MREWTFYLGKVGSWDELERLVEVFSKLLGRYVDSLVMPRVEAFRRLCELVPFLECFWPDYEWYAYAKIDVIRANLIEELAKEADVSIFDGIDVTYRTNVAHIGDDEWVGPWLVSLLRKHVPFSRVPWLIVSKEVQGHPMAVLWVTGGTAFLSTVLPRVAAFMRRLGYREVVVDDEE